MKVQPHPEFAIANTHNTDNQPITAGHSLSNSTQSETLTTDKQSVRKHFQFLRRFPNAKYSDGLKPVPLRSCLLHHKSAVFRSEESGKNTSKNGGNQPHFWIIKTEPRWFTHLLQFNTDLNTGEITEQSVYETDCLTSGNNRKIKAVNRFVAHFKEPYKRRKVSMLFYTFTAANQASVSIKNVFPALKKRLKRRGIGLKGYLWILEISSSLHVHYHAIVVTDRINCKGSELPDFLKMEDVWGARCQVQFIRKNVRYYLANYFTKNKNRIVDKRQYGMSIQKNK